MAERTNPFSLKVDLNVETMSVDVKVREKNDKGDFVEVDTKSFPLASIHADCRPSSDLYGYSKLLQDRCSDIKAGPSKIAAMEEVEAQLAAGQWERERKGGSPTVSAEVEALSILKGVSIPAIQKSLSKYTKEQKEGILSNEAVVAKAKEIRDQREAEEDLDLDSMIA